MDELTLNDYKRAHEEILKGMQSNQQAFELSILLHEQGIVTEKTKENVTKASVLAWVLERFKSYEEERESNELRAKNV